MDFNRRTLITTAAAGVYMAQAACSRAEDDGILRAPDLASAQKLTAGTVTVVRVGGYWRPGDGGDAVYRRTASEPPHSSTFRTCDGVWFTYSPEGQPADLRAFGAKGDGRHNDTEAFQRLNAFLAASDGGDVVIPPGTYLWGHQTLAGQTGMARAWNHRGGLSCDGLRNPVRIWAGGATLRTAPGLRFGAFDPVSGAPVISRSGFLNPDHRAQIGFALEFRSCASVRIYGYPHLHGDISAQIVGGAYSSDPADTTGVQLDHDGLVLIGCDDVYVEIGSANWFGRDGCQVGWPGLTADAPQKPHLLKLHQACWNGRQGLSYIGGNALTVDQIHASHNGKNGFVKSNPGAGIDIEA